MKIEKWNGYEIRFVMKNDEWWAVAVDVCKALGLKNVTRALSTLPYITTSKVRCELTNSKGTSRARKTQEVNIINEIDIYRLVFKSRKKEAIEFQEWIFKVIKELREATGLEGFQMFRMLDKEHQKDMMKHLRDSLKNPVRVDFIKANTITNKAISTKHGYPKMVKKGDMTPQMLVEREEILEDTVELMSVNNKFDLGISVSEKVYNKHTKRTGGKVNE